jgi:GalNAc-alpha-(1->4)-GalNAc-alpha-(1->3)-diNAcBac-PP-undecaprenol alpha-1,4-N-acetyl-D-galactosaminyltransferase
MKKLRLCLVIPTLQVGGMERVMSELAFYFSTRRNIELHLVIYGKTREIFYQLPEEIIIHKPSFEFNDRCRILYSIKTLLYLRRNIKQINPATILSFGELWNSFVLIALLFLRYPVYISDRCSPAKKFSLFHSFLRSVLYPKAHGIIAQTEKAKYLYHKIFKHNNIKVIGNPVRLNSEYNNERQNIILSIGRLIKTKHHDRLIRMFSKLDAPDWKLIIIGADALKENNLVQLQKLIKDLNLNDRVILTGEIKNVNEYYYKSKIFAFTSSSEGFPNVIAEALSAGLPVVAYDCIAGPSEMINDDVNGYLVPLFEDDLFQVRLQFLIDNHTSLAAMSEKASKSVRKFTTESVGAEYFNFLFSTNDK